MASFLALDAIISKHFPINDIALWAFAKSGLLLASALCIFGLDQVIVRRPSGLRKITKHLITRTIFVSAAISIAFTYTSKESSYIFWTLSIFLVAFLSICYAVYRGAFIMNAAQTSLNGWKSLLLLIIVTTITLSLKISIQETILIALLTSSLFIAIHMAITENWKKYYLDCEKKESSIELSDIKKEARHFFILSLSLNLSINFEQITLNILGFNEESASLLAHFSTFIPAVVFLNGLIGFYLGPHLKKNQANISKKTFRKINIILTTSGIALSITSFALGSLAFEVLYEGKFHIDTTTALLVILLGFLRLLYSAPSSFIGVIAPPKTLKIYSHANIGFFAFSIIFFFAIIGIGANPTASVLIASALNWGMRVIYGQILTYKDLT